MRPFSSSPATPQNNPSDNSSTANNNDATTRPPLPLRTTLPSRSPLTSASPLSLLSAARPFLSPSSGFLSSAESSLAGLSLSHEEARLARLANRGRTGAAPPAASAVSSSSSANVAPLPPNIAQSLAHSDRVLEESYSRLSLSPPSPTPSLMPGASSSIFARPAHQRRLWSRQADDDEDEEEVGGGRSTVGMRSVAVPAAAGSAAGGGNGGSGNGRQVSERQRQQMQYTESISPSPLEEPHEDTDERAASAMPAGAVASPVDSNPLSAAILYVYSLVTTSPADVAGLRPRDFILSIDKYSKRGWQPDMIEVTQPTMHCLTASDASHSVLRTFAHIVFSPCRFTVPQDVSKMILRWPDEVHRTQHTTLLMGQQMGESLNILCSAALCCHREVTRSCGLWCYVASRSRRQPTDATSPGRERRRTATATETETTAGAQPTQQQQQQHAPAAPPAAMVTARTASLHCSAWSCGRASAAGTLTSRNCSRAQSEAACSALYCAATRTRSPSAARRQSRRIPFRHPTCRASSTTRRCNVVAVL